MNTLRLPLLIGLTGKAGAGKDAVARHLRREHGYIIMSFADPIRLMLRPLIECVGQGDEWMHDRALKEKPIPGLDFSSRHLMQSLGTEWAREHLGENFWVRLLDFARQNKPHQHIVITDCRLANEFEYVNRSFGRIWRIERPGLPAVREHVSETEADTLNVDATLLNDGTLEHLAQRVNDQLMDIAA